MKEYPGTVRSSHISQVESKPSFKLRWQHESQHVSLEYLSSAKTKDCTFAWIARTPEEFGLPNFSSLGPGGGRRTVNAATAVDRNAWRSRRRSLCLQPDVGFQLQQQLDHLCIVPEDQSGFVAKMRIECTASGQ